MFVIYFFKDETERSELIVSYSISSTNVIINRNKTKLICIIYINLCKTRFHAVNLHGIASGPLDVSVTQLKIRYPTVLHTYPVDYFQMGLTLVALLDLFKWRKMSLMGDQSGASAIDFMHEMKMAFVDRAADFDLLSVSFNSSASNVSYGDLLRQSAKHSRSKNHS